MASGGHWYATPKTAQVLEQYSPGDFVSQVPGARGKMVSPQRRHAPQYGLVPGATSVLGLFSKDALVPWSAKTAAIEVVKPRKPHPLNPETRSPVELFSAGEIDEAELGKQAVALVNQARDLAAEAGTEVHNILEDWYNGDPVLVDGKPDPLCSRVDEVLEAEFGKRTWIAERSVYSENWGGYGGKIDLHSWGEDGLVVVDFKTRDFTPETIDKVAPYETEPMQLAAYANGLLPYEEDYAALAMLIERRKTATIRTANLYISRNEELEEPLVKLVVHDGETFDKAAEIFSYLCRIWHVRSGV